MTGTPQPKHYSRADWGGRPPRARYRLDPLEVKGVALHWPGISRPIHGVDNVAAALRAWQRDHMDNPDKLWSDIAYQIAVDQDGNTYGLRGLRYRSAANGDRDVNLLYGAFVLVVAAAEHPSPAMIATVRARVAAHRDLFIGSRLIVGHRDIRPEPTQCPGDLVDDLIDAGAFGNPHHRK